MPSRSANISVRVEPEIKEQAEKILDRLGLSASSFINMTYRQVILRNGIPFSVTLPTGIRTRDSMTEDEFDQMMQIGLDQAESGETIPFKQAFDELLRGI